MKRGNTHRTSFLTGIAAVLIMLFVLQGVLPFGQLTVAEAKTSRTSITGAKVTGIEDRTWTGKRITQKRIVIKVNGTSLLEGRDYSVSYRYNKYVGTAKVTIKGKGKYKGSVTKSFKIIPKTPKIVSAKRNGSKLTVKWTKIKHQVSGYQLAYSGAKPMGAKLRYAHKMKAGGRNTTSKKFGITATVIRYKVWIRSYKNVNGKKYYSDWSNYVAVYRDGSVYREEDDY